MPTRTLPSGSEFSFPMKQVNGLVQFLALLISIWYFVTLEAVSVACFLLRWPMCQEDRAGMCLSTGSGSVSGLEIFVCFPPDMVSSGLRQLPRLSFCSSVMILSIHQSRPICLGPLSTCQSLARNEERTLWKIGSDGLPSLSLQPVLGAAQVFNTLSPV